MSTYSRRHLLRSSGILLLGAGAVAAQNGGSNADDCNCTHAADGSPLDGLDSEIRPFIERYEVELRNLNRIFGAPGSSTRRAKLEKFFADQTRLLEAVNFDGLKQAGTVDYLLLRDRVQAEQKQLTREAREEDEMASLILFQQTIVGLEEARRRMDTIDAQKSATALAKIVTEIDAAKEALTKSKAQPAVLNRAAIRTGQLRNTLRGWFNFYDLYDPRFAWWSDGEFKKSDEALGEYARALHTKSGVPGPFDAGDATGEGGRGGGRGNPGGRGGGGAPRSNGAIGSNEELSGIGPVGNQVLVEALRAAMIPYTPDELITIANREFAWCDKEMLRASNEMGFGSDWKKALEAVKNKYVEPGEMIHLVRDQSREAIDFVEKHELVTIPEMVKEDYWEQAMTPQMQLVNPFFTGGATIQVSSPASTMTLEERLESMRGNNIYFSRATVFHELVPGHHMQQYMNQRYRPYRSLFSTAFWTEGMAFYWEMLLWDLGFTHTPEQRVGALFWRMHRCARIIFSLNFNLTKMTAVECVQFLVDRVGHERANAEGEVRRSFNGSYPPIYQCAYMLGALQFYALHKELVDSKKMTNRAFHDAIYRQGNIPVEMVRLAITGQKVSRTYQSSWRFYGALV
jgi:uncharacterized protein (DUF885 family)